MLCIISITSQHKHYHPSVIMTTTIPSTTIRKIAILMGGMGFKPKHVAKHAQLYMDREFDECIQLPPIPPILTESYIKQSGAKLANIITEHAQEGNDIYIHSISSSIFPLMRAMSRLPPVMKKDHVRSIVLDSPITDATFKNYMLGIPTVTRYPSVVVPLAVLPVAYLMLGSHWQRWVDGFAYPKALRTSIELQ